MWQRSKLIAQRHIGMTGDLLIAAAWLGNGSANLSVALNWDVAEQAVFSPFLLTKIAVLTHLWWANGNVVSGNIDCGIYDAAGNRIVSAGSTAQAGTVQRVSISTLALTPGLYYGALVADNTTARLAAGANSFTQLAASYIGYAVQASAFPLPSTATFAESSAAIKYFHYGFIISGTSG